MKRGQPNTITTTIRNITTTMMKTTKMATTTTIVTAATIKATKSDDSSRNFTLHGKIKKKENRKNNPKIKPKFNAEKGKSALQFGKLPRSIVFSRNCYTFDNILLCTRTNFRFLLFFS